MTQCTQTIRTEDLLSLDVGRVSFDECLKSHNTWRIGGRAAVMVFPENIAQLSNALAFVHQNGLNHLTIGAGSNLLFSDSDINSIVIKIGPSMSGCDIEDTLMTVQAGLSIPRLARLAYAAGLGGLEHTVGIPGTLGGLVAMNGGSLGSSIGTVVQAVRCVDPAGNIVEFDNASCEFSYRHSFFLENDLTVAEVQLQLEQKQPKVIFSEMLEILRQRRQKFPRRQPNCGCVFKRNVELFKTFGPPGKVIEDLGLKGFSIGDAQVSDRHAGFIVNTGHARASDVLALIHTVRDCVFEATGFWLDCEVRHVGPAGNIQPAHMPVT